MAAHRSAGAVGNFRYAIFAGPWPGRLPCPGPWSPVVLPASLFVARSQRAASPGPMNGDPALLRSQACLISERVRTGPNRRPAPRIWREPSSSWRPRCEHRSWKSTLERSRPDGGSSQFVRHRILADTCRGFAEPPVTRTDFFFTPARQGKPREAVAEAFGVDHGQFQFGHAARATFQGSAAFSTPSLIRREADGREHPLLAGTSSSQPRRKADLGRPSQRSEKSARGRPWRRPGTGHLRSSGFSTRLTGWTESRRRWATLHWPRLGRCCTKLG